MVLQNGEFKEIRSDEIVVGDLVMVKEDEVFPADLILLTSSSNGFCYI